MPDHWTNPIHTGKTTDDYMLRQLHAYYMILHAFTIDSMQLQALQANPIGPRDFSDQRPCQPCQCHGRGEETTANFKISREWQTPATLKLPILNLRKLVWVCHYKCINWNAKVLTLWLQPERSSVQSSMAFSESISTVNLSFSTISNIFDRLLARVEVQVGRAIRKLSYAKWNLTH